MRKKSISAVIPKITRRLQAKTTIIPAKVSARYPTLLCSSLILILYIIFGYKINYDLPVALHFIGSKTKIKKNCSKA